jgi:hypothetical protein
MWRTANLDLRAQVGAAYRAGENDLIGGVVAALHATTRSGANNFHGHAFILGIGDMFSFSNGAD